MYIYVTRAHAELELRLMTMMFAETSEGAGLLFPRGFQLTHRTRGRERRSCIDAAR